MGNNSISSFIPRAVFPELGLQPRYRWWYRRVHNIVVDLVDLELDEALPAGPDLHRPTPVRRGLHVPTSIDMDGAEFAAAYSELGEPTTPESPRSPMRTVKPLRENSLASSARRNPVEKFLDSKSKQAWEAKVKDKAGDEGRVYRNFYAQNKCLNCWLHGGYTHCISNRSLSSCLSCTSRGNACRVVESHGAKYEFKRLPDKKEPENKFMPTYYFVCAGRTDMEQDLLSEQWMNRTKCLQCVLRKPGGPGCSAQQAVKAAGRDYKHTTHLLGCICCHERKRSGEDDSRCMAVVQHHQGKLFMTYI